MLKSAFEELDVPENRPASAPIVLSASGLKKSFGGQTVLNGVDIELRQGEVVLLRGENGSGKTTLLNILTGNVEPDEGVIRYQTDGSLRSYRFPREWWRELNPWDHFRPEFVAREGIGRTWQDVRLFATQTVLQNVEVSAPGQLGENPILALTAPSAVRNCERRMRARADEVLSRVGFSGDAEDLAATLSLGESKRVAIARALASGSKILFLDEPLSGLDRRGIDELLGVLEALARQQQITMVLVEHVFNHQYVSSLVTTDWLLDRGRIRCFPKSVAQSTVATSRHHETTTAAEQPVWMSSLANIGDTITEVLPRGAVLTRIRPRDVADPPRRIAFDIRRLVVKRASRTVIGLDAGGIECGLDLQFYEGEVAILQAPNGWGKTTLFEAIAGLIPITSGEIVLRGEPVERFTPWDRVRRGLRALPSEPQIFPSLSARDVFRLAGTAGSSNGGVAFIDKSCAELSGGQKQRLALAALPVGDVTLYDEPISGLDNAEPFLKRCLAADSSRQVSLVFTPSAIH